MPGGGPIGKGKKTQSNMPAAAYNSKGYPIRPDASDCAFYLKTQECKYGNQVSSFKSHVPSYVQRCSSVPIQSSGGRIFGCKTQPHGISLESGDGGLCGNPQMDVRARFFSLQFRLVLHEDRAMQVRFDLQI